MYAARRSALSFDSGFPRSQKANLPPSRMAWRISLSADSRSWESRSEKPATAEGKAPGLKGRNSKTHCTRSNSLALASILREASARTGTPPACATTLESVPGPEPRSSTSAPSPAPTAKEATLLLISLSAKSDIRLEPFS